MATESAKAEAVKQWKRESVVRKKNLLFWIADHISMGAEHMLRIMQQTPVLIFNVNTLAAPFNKELSMVEQVSEICNAESIGAAIKNMTLEDAAQVSDLCTGSAVCIRNDNKMNLFKRCLPYSDQLPASLRM